MPFDPELFGDPLDEVCDCASRGDVSRLRELLDEYPETLSAFEADAMWWTPLHHAIQGKQHDVVVELLARGANPNAHDESKIGDTPLDLAVRGHRLEIARLLIDAGREPEHPDLDVDHGDGPGGEAEHRAGGAEVPRGVAGVPRALHARCGGVSSSGISRWHGAGVLAADA